MLSTFAKQDHLGSPELSGEFHDLSDALSSNELKDLLNKDKWSQFFEVISLLIQDVETLKNKARSFANRHRKGSASEDEDSVTLEWAHHVLKVKPTATNKEIKKAFRALCVKWHPDTNKVRDDTKIKEITNAYHVLKKTKQFA